MSEEREKTDFEEAMEILETLEPKAREAVMLLFNETMGKRNDA
jgi:hypothetical protein